MAFKLKDFIEEEVQIIGADFKTFGCITSITAETVYVTRYKNGNKVVESFKSDEFKNLWLVDYAIALDDILAIEDEMIDGVICADIDEVVNVEIDTEYECSDDELIDERNDMVERIRNKTGMLTGEIIKLIK